MGDVIYIEANSGAVKRVGRSDAYASEFDLEAEEYVPLPKGDVHKRKEIVQVGAWHGMAWHGMRMVPIGWVWGCVESVPEVGFASA